jgi:hypothetical protein
VPARSGGRSWSSRTDRGYPHHERLAHICGRTATPAKADSDLTKWPRPRSPIDLAWRATSPGPPAQAITRLEPAARASTSVTRAGIGSLKHRMTGSDGVECSQLAVMVILGTASAPAVVAGCALWWALTARADLVPPARTIAAERGRKPAATLPRSRSRSAPRRGGRVAEAVGPVAASVALGAGGRHLGSDVPVTAGTGESQRPDQEEGHGLGVRGRCRPGHGRRWSGPRHL